MQARAGSSHDPVELDTASKAKTAAPAQTAAAIGHLTSGMYLRMFKNAGAAQALRKATISPFEDLEKVDGGEVLGERYKRLEPIWRAGERVMKTILDNRDARTAKNNPLQHDVMRACPTGKRFTYTHGVNYGAKGAEGIALAADMGVLGRALMGVPAHFEERLSGTEGEKSNVTTHG